MLANLRGQFVTAFLNILKAAQTGFPESRGVITPLLLESGLCRVQSFDWMDSDAVRVPEDVEEARLSVFALAFAHLEESLRVSVGHGLSATLPNKANVVTMVVNLQN